MALIFQYFSRTATSTDPFWPPLGTINSANCTKLLFILFIVIASFSTKKSDYYYSNSIEKGEENCLLISFQNSFTVLHGFNISNQIESESESMEKCRSSPLSSFISFLKFDSIQILILKSRICSQCVYGIFFPLRFCLFTTVKCWMLNVFFLQW